MLATSYNAERQQTSACMFATSVNFRVATKEEMMNNLHTTWTKITLSVRLTGATQYRLNSRIFAVGIIRFLYTHRHATSTFSSAAAPLS